MFRGLHASPAGRPGLLHPPRKEAFEVEDGVAVGGPDAIVAGLSLELEAEGTVELLAKVEQ